MTKNNTSSDLRVKAIVLAEVISLSFEIAVQVHELFTTVYVNQVGFSLLILCICSFDGLGRSMEDPEKRILLEKRYLLRLMDTWSTIITYFILKTLSINR